MSSILEGLASLDRQALVEVWEVAFKQPPPPNTSQDMMRLIVGWEMQAKTARSDVRALKSEVNRLLKPRPSGKESLEPAKPKADLSPGTRLSRDWKGCTYTVDILDKGYAYDGKLFT